MNSISVSAYEVSIHKKNHRKSKKEFLNDFDNGKDVLKLFQNLPAMLNNAQNENTLVDDIMNKRRLRIKEEVFKPFGRCVHGVLESGDYGVESPIVDSSGKDVGLISKDMSVMIPFYFLCELEENSKSGF